MQIPTKSPPVSEMMSPLDSGMMSPPVGKGRAGYPGLSSFWVEVNPEAGIFRAGGCALRGRAGGRCEASGPGWRRRRSGPRASQDAPIFDRIVSRITVTDPHHALSGREFPLVDPRSGRGPTYVVVELPDGRRRSIRRAATDLLNPSLPASVGAEPDHARISIRTLLPLARYFAATLASSIEEATCDVDHTSTTPALPRPDVYPDEPATAVAEPARPGSGPRCPDHRRAPASPAVAASSRKRGEPSC